MYDVAMQAISDQHSTAGQSECWNCSQPGHQRRFCPYPEQHLQAGGAWAGPGGVYPRRRGREAGGVYPAGGPGGVYPWRGGREAGGVYPAGGPGGVYDGRAPSS
eukprot:125771-Rhodomonas_salina.1